MLWGGPYTITVLPDSFLGRSAPRLQILKLYRIPFPRLPELLLCSIHLVRLDIEVNVHGVLDTLLPAEVLRVY